MAKPVRVVACKGCGSTTRDLKYTGPRCATCWRAELVARSSKAHARYLMRTYSITAEQYWEMYEQQGGACAICARATGKTKRLAVDHDHACCPGATSCGRCVRGLLCGPCNQFIGRLGDSPAVMVRAAGYLQRNRNRDGLFVVARDGVPQSR